MTRSPLTSNGITATTRAADDLFAVLKSGAVKVAVHQRFALKDAAKTQEALTAKKMVGATILIP